MQVQGIKKRVATAGTIRISKGRHRRFIREQIVFMGGR